MKKALIILVSILALAGYSFAQADENPGCPNLSILGPSVPPKLGETGTFTLHPEGAGKDLKLDYAWAISSGEITSGQGTSILTVRYSDRNPVTATVQVKGLPDGCPNSWSENTGCDLGSDPPELLGSFPGPLTAKEKARLITIYERLEADPNARGVIFLAGTVRQIKANKQMIMKFVIKFYKDPARVTFVDLDAENEMTEFWLVPSGADEPEPGKKGSKILSKRPVGPHSLAEKSPNSNHEITRINTNHAKRIVFSCRGSQNS